MQDTSEAVELEPVNTTPNKELKVPCLDCDTALRVASKMSRQFEEERDTKKTFLLRQKVLQTLNSDISNDAKIFYIKLFLTMLPDVCEFVKSPCFIRTKIPVDSALYPYAVVGHDEKIINELLERQLISITQIEGVNTLCLRVCSVDRLPACRAD